MYRTMRRASLIVSALFVAACGSSTSPLTPAPSVVPVVPTSPAVITLSGHATATNGRQALSGLAVDFGGVGTQTDGAGNFQYQLTRNVIYRFITGRRTS